MTMLTSKLVKLSVKGASTMCEEFVKWHISTHASHQSDTVG